MTNRIDWISVTTQAIFGVLYAGGFVLAMAFQLDAPKMFILGGLTAAYAPGLAQFIALKLFREI